jgi:hypothetical protein
VTGGARAVEAGLRYRVAIADGEQRSPCGPNDTFPRGRQSGFRTRIGEKQAGKAVLTPFSSVNDGGDTAADTAGGYW